MSNLDEPIPLVDDRRFLASVGQLHRAPQYPLGQRFRITIEAIEDEQ
jgi:hypothetical protein